MTCALGFLVRRLGAGFCVSFCSNVSAELVVLVEGAGLFLTLEASSSPGHFTQLVAPSARIELTCV